jgi:hypothetical protein
MGLRLPTLPSASLTSRRWFDFRAISRHECHGGRSSHQLIELFRRRSGQVRWRVGILTSLAASERRMLQRGRVRCLVQEQKGSRPPSVKVEAEEIIDLTYG